MSATIAVSDLKVGMFVHLDLGWMAHPFPLSSFKITSTDQIDTIRTLGLTRVRWVRSRSDLTDAESPALPADAAPAAAQPAPAEDPAAEAARQAKSAHQAKLDAQRAAVRRCERQFTEACQDLKRTVDKSTGDPVAAGQQAQALSGALLDKMMVAGDLCVRVLVEGAGDRASAHALNVAVLSMLMGRAFGLPREEMLELGVGALLHDIGKQDLPDRVRHVDNDVPSPELALYRDHVALGVARARRMQLGPLAQLVIAQHHEAADGSGFPKGLQLDRMSVAARVVALVNRYDNLCNAASLARSLTPHEALSRLFAQSRAKFDNTMLNAFIRMMGIYPPGSVVQLTDDRYALVISVNSSRPLKPTVMVCDPSAPAHQALHLDLEQCGDLGIRRSLRPSLLPLPAAEYLQPRQRVSYFFDAVQAESLVQETAG